jgi:hypothetical protein
VPIVITPYWRRRCGGAIPDIKAPTVIAGNGSSFDRTGASYPTQLDVPHIVTEAGHPTLGGPTFPVTVKFFEEGTWSSFDDAPLSWLSPSYDPSQSTSPITVHFNVTSDPGFDDAAYYVDIVAQDGAGNYDYATGVITITSS